MLSKLFLSGIAVFILPGTPAQVVIASLSSLLSLHVLLALRPYVNDDDNATAVAAKCVAARARPTVISHRLSQVGGVVSSRAHAHVRHFTPRLL